MKEVDSYKEDREEGGGLVHNLYYKFVPYLPLFALLSVILAVLLFVFASFGTPTYKITASIAISDEEKGAGDASLLRSLNIYTSKKIIENEIQVLQSRSLIRTVVDSLALYAPVLEAGKRKPVSAYTTSPIKIRLKDPEKLTDVKEVPFVWDNLTQKVSVNQKTYPLDTWITFPFGTLKFERNLKQLTNNKGSLFFTLVNPKQVGESISKALKISGTGKLATIISIQYSDEVAERGEDFVNELLDAYNRFSLQSKNQLALNTLEFLDQRLRRVAAELNSIEKRVQTYRTTQGVVDISEQGKIYLESVAESDRKLADINTQLAVLDQVEKYVQSGATREGVIPTSLGIEDPVLSVLLQQLNDLELRYANLRATTSENNPTVQSVASEIKLIRPNILNIVVNQRSRLRARQNNQQQSTNQYSTQLRSLPSKERALLDISREQTTMREIYAFLLQKREDAALTNASVISNSSVIDRAEAGSIASGPSKIIFLVGAIVLALVITIVYILLKEHFTSKILFRNDIEQETDIKVVGETIFQRKASNKKEATLQYQWNQIQAALGLLALDKAGSKKFMITSWLPNEGKTFVTTGLAQSIAATGKSVVILDLNLYNKKASVQLASEEQSGFTDYIFKSLAPEKIVYKTSYDNLYIVPAGSHTNNPLALFLDPKLKELIAYLESRYDCVLVDSPSLHATTDAYALKSNVDKVIWVMRHNATPKRVFTTLNKNWNKHNTAIIFNAVKGRGLFKLAYGNGYGYGYDSIRTNTYKKVES